MQAPQKCLDRFPDIADSKRQKLAAMLSALDDGVGQVLEALRDAGIEDNTLIFCISDNGGTPKANASVNDPLSGGKGSMLEGGIRVPFIIRWPRRIPAGLVYHEPVSTLDVLPTAVAAAGGKLPQDRIMDGVDLVPHLTGEKSATPHDIILWRMGPRYAVRKRNWKLVQERTGGPALFDLSKDIGESNDLAQRRPEKLDELMDEYARWDSQMVDALWQWKTTSSAAPATRTRER
jgi:arylsulfatase A-like enzyme